MFLCHSERSEESRSDLSPSGEVAPGAGEGANIELNARTGEGANISRNAGSLDSPLSTLPHAV